MATRVVSRTRFEQELWDVLGDPKTPKVPARKLRKLLEDDSRRGVRRREAFYQRAQAQFEARKPGQFGDGEFLKWFLAWLQSGGWEQIMKWIAAIIALFSL